MDDSSDDLTRKRVLAAQRGDSLAQEHLMRQYLGGLRAFVRLRCDARLRLRESESDLVQSICREVLSDLGGFEYRNEASFRCWLFSVALNKIREKGRFHDAACRTPTREEGSWNDSGGLPGRHAGGYTPSEYAIARESEEQFEAAFDLLSEDHREIIVLSRILRLSHAEIAERLGRSEVAVRSLLSRALVALSARLQRSTKHG